MSWPAQGGTLAVPVSIRASSPALGVIHHSCHGSTAAQSESDLSRVGQGRTAGEGWPPRLFHGSGRESRLVCGKSRQNQWKTARSCGNRIVISHAAPHKAGRDRSPLPEGLDRLCSPERQGAPSTRDNPDPDWLVPWTAGAKTGPASASPERSGLRAGMIHQRPAGPGPAEPLASL